jgi:hypothetical protein
MCLEAVSTIHLFLRPPLENVKRLIELMDSVIVNVNVIRVARVKILLLSPKKRTKNHPLSLSLLLSLSFSFSLSLFLSASLSFSHFPRKTLTISTSAAAAVMSPLASQLNLSLLPQKRRCVRDKWAAAIGNALLDGTADADGSSHK